MIGNVVYGVWDNREKLLWGYVGLAVINPGAAQKLGEIMLRVGYAAVKENIRTIGTGFTETWKVLTRKPGIARPPIIPATDKAILRSSATRLLSRGAVALASPKIAIGGALIGGGLLISHGIGQLPAVQKAPPERGQPGMLMGVF